MPTETFDTPDYRYTCVSPSEGRDACVIRHRRGGVHSGRQWVRDEKWIVPRYRTYAEAREAAERFAAGDEGAGRE